MNRGALERHLRAQGCNVKREGGNHTIWVNFANNLTAPIPRHQDIKMGLVRKICKMLGVLPPAGR